MIFALKKSGIIFSLFVFLGMNTSSAMDAVKSLGKTIIQNPSVQIVGGVAVANAATNFLGDLVLCKLHDENFSIDQSFIKNILAGFIVGTGLSAITLIPAMRIGSWPKLEPRSLVKPWLYCLGVTSGISLLAGINKFRKSQKKDKAVRTVGYWFDNLQAYGLPLTLSLVMGFKRYMASK